MPVNLGLIISSVALGISLVVSAIKLFEWFIHAEPRVVIRVGQRLLFLLAIAAVPCLILLLFYQQWALAMTLGAGMLIMPLMLNLRSILSRPKFRPMWTDGDLSDDMHSDFGPPPPGPELVSRAVKVLENYLTRARHPQIASRQRSLPLETPPSIREGLMSADEALEVLGLEPGATVADVHAAHHRLLQLVHPDRGGTNYLAAAINNAKETLLAEVPCKPPASMRNGLRAVQKRAAGMGE